MRRDNLTDDVFEAYVRRIQKRFGMSISAARAYAFANF
jgi:hypothetical protein